MHVLNLTTNENSPIFRQQVRALEEQGIECTSVSIQGTTGVNSPRSLLDYLRFYPDVLKHSFRKYDLVHANYGLTAPFALAQLKLPVVLSLWGSDLYGQYGWTSKLCANYCDATIVMSERMARDLGQDCYVIPHGVDLDQFAPISQSVAVNQIGWDPNAKHVLFPYSPDRDVKNYPRAERLVDAAREAVDAPVKLQSVWGISHEKMPRYMNAADCLLLTSHHEGSPNVVKEALACNLPVVSVDVGDVRERLSGVEPSVVSDDDTELRTALESILSRGERSNGRQYAKEISKNRMGEQLQEIYNVVADVGNDVSHLPAIEPTSN